MCRERRGTVELWNYYFVGETGGGRERGREGGGRYGEPYLRRKEEVGMPI